MKFKVLAAMFSIGTISSGFSQDACENKVRALMHVLNNCPGVLEAAQKEGAATSAEEITYDANKFEHKISFTQNTGSFMGPGKITRNFRKIVLKELDWPGGVTPADAGAYGYRCSLLNEKGRVIATFGKAEGNAEAGKPAKRNPKH